MEKYEDIINLPHHVSENHPQMPVEDRAAQFSPFAALTGYEDAIDETARITQMRMNLDEDEKVLLNAKLLEIKEHLSEHPRISITYYEPDKRKEGGAYLTVEGNIRKIDEYQGMLIFEDGTHIDIEQISAVTQY